MNVSAKTAVMVAAALLAAATITGCGVRGRAAIGARTPAAASIAATTTQTPVAAAGAQVPAATSKGLNDSDLQSLNKELDAMQKEIDGLNMPSESDYSGAADAVY